ncbi:hypothetical protein D8I24_1377 [Cupriavidus necator H850]|nr:hypothetical protein D8I24_3997 [Cupriavidus necator H850]KAI3607226.1 hypothetical protein D8I24_1376 [Cupriavidus necator H850]KAI3607227.1 hypothetical protein D8I24_1377 [Cupriavidus necator H850]
MIASGRPSDCCVAALPLAQQSDEDLLRNSFVPMPVDNFTEKPLYINVGQ